jgi:hypothetical protein
MTEQITEKKEKQNNKVRDRIIIFKISQKDFDQIISYCERKNISLSDFYKETFYKGLKEQENGDYILLNEL